MCALMACSDDASVLILNMLAGTISHAMTCYLEDQDRIMEDRKRRVRQSPAVPSAVELCLPAGITRLVAPAAGCLCVPAVLVCHCMCVQLEIGLREVRISLAASVDTIETRGRQRDKQNLVACTHSICICSTSNPSHCAAAAFWS